MLQLDKKDPSEANIAVDNHRRVRTISTIVGIAIVIMLITAAAIQQPTVTESQLRSDIKKLKDNHTQKNSEIEKLKDTIAKQDKLLTTTQQSLHVYRKKSIGHKEYNKQYATVHDVTSFNEWKYNSNNNTIKRDGLTEKFSSAEYGLWAFELGSKDKLRSAYIDGVFLDNINQYDNKLYLDKSDIQKLKNGKILVIRSANNEFRSYGLTGTSKAFTKAGM